MSDDSFEVIKFDGQEFILVDGAITTPDEYAAGVVGYAHLCDDGKVRRFGKVIGDESGIERTGERVSVEMTTEGCMEALGGFLSLGGFGGWSGDLATPRPPSVDGEGEA